MQPLILDAAQREWQLYRAEYELFLDRQLADQHFLDRISPGAIQNRITSSLSQTDIFHFESFLDQARQHQADFVSYLKDDRMVFTKNANLFFCRQTMDQILNNNYEERMRLRREPLLASKTR